VCATAIDDKLDEDGFVALYSLIDNLFEDEDEDVVVVAPDVSKTTTTTTYHQADKRNYWPFWRP
jgi:hypothetical protein